MIFSPHENFIIAVLLFEPVPELHSGTERSSFSDKFRRPGPEASVLSVNRQPCKIYLMESNLITYSFWLVLALLKSSSVRLNSIGRNELMIMLISATFTYSQ